MKLIDYFFLFSLDQQLYYKSALKEIETLMSDMNGLISEWNAVYFKFHFLSQEWEWSELSKLKINLLLRNKCNYAFLESVLHKCGDN